MTNEGSEECYIEKEMRDINLEDAETTLLETDYNCNRSQVKSLLEVEQAKEASLHDIEMPENIQNVSNGNPDVPEINTQQEQTMLENETRMMKNIFLMRSDILSMQVKVATYRLKTLKSLEGIVDNTNETKNHRREAKIAFDSGNCVEADTNLLKAEQLYKEMANKLFPAKPKKDQKPSGEYLRMKKPVTGSNRPGVTVRGTTADVKACIEKARIAFGANELEKAKKWLDKSERMMHTVNARELLGKVLAAIAARDAPKEVPNVETEVDSDTVADLNSTVDQNIKDMSDQTNLESPRKSTAVSDNVIGANKFIENAKKAFEAGDFEKAKHFLSKAKRMNSNLDINIHLKSLQDAMDKKNATPEDNSVPHNAPQEPNRSMREKKFNKNEADTYIEVAKNAFNDKNYDRALIFLNKAENLFSSDRAKDLRKKVVDAKSKHEIDSIIKAVRIDLKAGKLEEAEKKLEAYKVFTCRELENLREEIRNRKLSKKRQKKPKPVKIVPPPKEKLSDIRKEDAETFTKIAEKAYQDGDFNEAERLLKKAERLHPSEKSKNILDKVKIALEKKSRQETVKPINSEIDSYRAAADRTPETNVNDEVQKFLNSGLDDMQKQNYDDAEVSFQKAFDLKPCKSIKELIADAQSEIKKRDKQTGPVVTPKTVEGNRATAEETPETNVDDEVQKLLHSGLDDMRKQNYDDAEVSYQKIIKPCKSIEELVVDAQSEIKKRDNKTGPVVTQRTVEDGSAASQNTQTEKTKNKHKLDVIAYSIMYTGWAQDAYENGDIKSAESFLKQSELFHSTERSRDLQVRILRAKHQINYSDYDDTNTTIIVQHIRQKKKTEPKVFSEKGYLRTAEETFISGEFKVAHDLVSRPEVNKSPYVIELKEKIEKAQEMHTRGWNWVIWLK